MNIGHNIRRIREFKNISRKELYIDAKISPATLFRLENNYNKYINQDYLSRIAKCLKVEVSDLITSGSSIDT
jgi:DNA-binding Xre family transcriptional regulator